MYVITNTQPYMIHTRVMHGRCVTKCSKMATKAIT